MKLFISDSRQVVVDYYRLILNRLNRLEPSCGSGVMIISGSNYHGKSRLVHTIKSILDSSAQLKQQQESNRQHPYSSDLIPAFNKDIRQARLLEADTKATNFFGLYQTTFFYDLYEEFWLSLHKFAYKLDRSKQKDQQQTKFFHSLVDAIRYIKKQLQSLVKKWVVRWKRDLRNVYTTILRFHFKSMDDCSHDEVLFSPAHQTTVFLNNLNNHLYEKAGNYRPASGYT